jgi:hypothetical protein
LGATGAEITFRAPGLISISEREIRRAYLIDIGLIIGRDDLAISIIDPGLGAQGLRYCHPVPVSRLDLPTAERMERVPSCPDHIWPEEVGNIFRVSVKLVLK